MPVRLGDYYNRLFDDRLAGDYEPSTRFEPDEARRMLSETRDFIEWRRSLVICES
jgi:uncharacterized protein (UPF0332 family)